MTRQFRASRDLVFRAMSEPEHLEHWWGPYGRRATVQELDFRIGSEWRL
jgi:uncharacterized protein YndB with AHSA1/START domain